MREIKFRAWDDTEKVMRVVDCIVFLKNGTHRIMSGDEILNTEGDKYGKDTLMQFTGLHDKNGKEIYEGDIVTAWSEGVKGTFKIKWRQEGSPCWILYPAWNSQKMWHISAIHHTSGKQFISVSAEISTTKKEGYFDDGLEVIGNIYENPELIK